MGEGAQHDTEVLLRNKTKLCLTIGAVGAAFLSALAPAGQAATVCNEAENSPRGGYVVSGGIVDPAPPAFLRDSQMRVGDDDAQGLDNAADRSPALRQCEPSDGDGGGGGGGDV
jgi:hypothetical protein